ncbi:hypothetical protein KM043_000375 [Ampulex compressa]|nr:hypothetical protein KM043_000375 [Ampulex compressa]
MRGFGATFPGKSSPLRTKEERAAESTNAHEDAPRCGQRPTEKGGPGESKRNDLTAITSWQINVLSRKGKFRDRNGGRSIRKRGKERNETRNGGKAADSVVEFGRCPARRSSRLSEPSRKVRDFKRAAIMEDDAILGMSRRGQSGPGRGKADRRGTYIETHD